MNNHLTIGQAPLSMEFSSKEYWSGLPFPSPGDLPNPGSNLGLFVYPALAYLFTLAYTYLFVSMSY